MSGARKTSNVIYSLHRDIEYLIEHGLYRNDLSNLKVAVIVKFKSIYLIKDYLFHKYDKTPPLIDSNIVTPLMKLLNIKKGILLNHSLDVL